MSYAILHMQKFKGSSLKGIQFHNQRERESKTNPDIDKSKTNLNYDLHNKTNIDYNEKIKEIIKDNVVTNRAIRKDAVLMCNFVLTSDKNFFDRLIDLEQERFFEKSYEFFKKRYGEEKIVSATVHLDEKTPHMHLSLVPVTEDKKLSAKRLFDRKELRILQDEYPKYMNENGFELERGIDAEGKNKHIETQKLKAMTLVKNINELQSRSEALKSKIYTFMDVQVDLDKINRIEGKEGRLNKKKITIDKDEFEDLKTMAKKHLILDREKQGLENRKLALEKELKEYKRGSLDKKLKSIKIQKELSNLQKENKEMFEFIVKEDKLDDFIEYSKEQLFSKKKLNKKIDREIVR